MRWEGLERRKLTWTQFWDMEASNISFSIRATYDVLPSPKNLQAWYKQLIFLPEIAATTLRPDLVLWSPSLRSVNIIELTVPWESLTEEAYEPKKLRYTELAADAQQQGWKAKVYPVEVGCRGFVAYSTIRLLKDLGIHG